MTLCFKRNYHLDYELKEELVMKCEADTKATVPTFASLIESNDKLYSRFVRQRKN